MLDGSCGACACTPSIQSQRKAGGDKLSLASLAVLASSPDMAVGAMEEPPQSLHLLLTRLCSQMEAPAQSLHWLLRRLCSQMEAPPQSLH